MGCDVLQQYDIFSKAKPTHIPLYTKSIHNITFKYINIFNIIVKGYLKQKNDHFVTYGPFVLCMCVRQSFWWCIPCSVLRENIFCKNHEKGPQNRWATHGCALFWLGWIFNDDDSGWNRVYRLNSLWLRLC